MVSLRACGDNPTAPTVAESHPAFRRRSSRGRVSQAGSAPFPVGTPTGRWTRTVASSWRRHEARTNSAPRAAMATIRSTVSRSSTPTCYPVVTVHKPDTAPRLRHMAGDEVARLRELCLALPETTERLSHGEPCFFVRSRKTFVSVDDHHHGGRAPRRSGARRRPARRRSWSPPTRQRFFRPPYVGHRGWLGMRLRGRRAGRRPTGPRSTRSSATPTARSRRRPSSRSWTAEHPA